MAKGRKKGKKGKKGRKKVAKAGRSKGRDSRPPQEPRRVAPRGPTKGPFSEYLDAKLDPEDLAQERKRQLARIAEIRKRDVLVYAADASKHQPPRINASITSEDLLAINDQLSVLSRRNVDVILETTGGSGEAAEDIVKLIRSRFRRVGFIIPGQAKSAGTIMVMSADDILMEPASSLGPIDAQISRDGKTLSAHAMLEGFEKIKQEAEKANRLNRAYIPMLQRINPGDLQACENAQNFSKILVSEWLRKYKFSRWNKHSQSGLPVSDQEKLEHAEEIAKRLRDHGRWLTHGRSIKIEDLREMGLEIIDYSKRLDLCDAIRRYYILLQMTFMGTPYKIIETPHSQIMRHVLVEQPKPMVVEPKDGSCELELECTRCHAKTKVQANLGKKQPLKPGCVAFPRDNRLACRGCGVEHALSGVRKDLERQTGLPIV